MRLDDLQHAFVGLVAGDAEAKAALQPLLQDTPAFPLAKRLAVYQRNYLGALRRALGATYPACRTAVGSRHFGCIATGYIERYPSREPDLNRYGSMLPAYLSRSLSDGILSEFPYLPELAQLEWYWHSAYYAANDPQFDLSALAAVAPDDQPRIRFRVSRALALMRAAHQPFACWQALNAGARPSVTNSNDPELLCIYRQNGDPVIQAFSATRFALLLDIAAGACLGLLAEHHPNISEEIPSFVNMGLITGSELAS